ncbi:MAG: BON domain-containing protein [Paludibacteraceae bacterium]|nr:BON domain-containing protein [Paludibacteraceae bacterium]
MKKTSFLSMLALTLLIAVGVTSCKPKDADILKAVQTAIATSPDAAGVTAAVDKGVVTLTGEVKDEATSIALNALAAGVKNVKSVVNNLTVVPPAPIISASDQAIIDGLVAALKDNPTVTSAVKDGIITLTGEVKKADLPKILQKISTLKPVKIDNQLTVK